MDVEQQFHLLKQVFSLLNMYLVNTKKNPFIKDSSVLQFKILANSLKSIIYTLFEFALGNTN